MQGQIRALSGFFRGGMGRELIVAGFAQRVAEPFQTFVQPVSRGGAG